MKAKSTRTINHRAKAYATNTDTGFDTLHAYLVAKNKMQTKILKYGIKLLICNSHL